MKRYFAFNIPPTFRQVIGLLLLCPALLSSQPRKIKLPAELNEVSGLYYAGPDSLWWHNDGGNAPVLYLTDSQGRVQKRVDLPLRNIDWEDLTADDAGRLYIGDFGNNAQRRRDLRIYCYDPTEETLDSISFHYPDQVGFPPAQGSYDAEAFFWHNDSLHLFTKSKLPKGDYLTKHYALPARPGAQTAELRDSLFLRRRAITGAAFDRATGTMALVGYFYGKFLGLIPRSSGSVFFFRHFPPGRFLQGDYKRKSISCLVSLQYEAIDFSGGRFLYVAAEKTAFIKPKAKRVRVWGF